MKKRIMEIKQIVNTIDGWLTDIEGELLYYLAKNCSGKGAIVEIGSWKGKSTIWLAKGSKDGNKAKVYAIDPHTGSSEHRRKYRKIWTFEEFKKNIKKANVEDIVIPIVKTSEEAAKSFNEPIELIFIDGAHEYSFVKKDFLLWFPKLINGGIMAFHDTTNHIGPKKVVEEYLYKSAFFKDVKLIGSITYAVKVPCNSLSDKIKNRYRLLLKRVLFDNMYSFAGKVKLPIFIKKLGNNIIKSIQ